MDSTAFLGPLLPEPGVLTAQCQRPKSRVIWTTGSGSPGIWGGWTWDSPSSSLTAPA